MAVDQCLFYISLCGGGVPGDSVTNKGTPGVQKVGRAVLPCSVVTFSTHTVYAWWHMFDGFECYFFVFSTQEGACALFS